MDKVILGFSLQTGVPQPTVSWHRKEGPLSTSASLLLNASLLLRNVTLQDSGIYSCVAANQIGKWVASSLLRVAGEQRFSGRPYVSPQFAG